MTANLDLAQFEGHAPGPWTDIAHKDANVYGPNMRNIYTLADNMPPLAERVHKVNARLIAAAPVLLAECRRQREQIKALREALDMVLEASEDNGTGDCRASWGKSV